MNLGNLRHLIAVAMSGTISRHAQRVLPLTPAILVDRCVRAAHKPDDAWSDREADQILEEYRSFDEAGRIDFLKKLAAVLEPPMEQLEHAADSFLNEQGPEAVRRLHSASTPLRHLLFSRLNEAKDGTACLLSMRAMILALLKTHDGLAPLEADLRLLFSNWFNRAFLVLRRVDWSSPANVLMRIIDYEAVHEIKDWNDLRRRIDPPDRACFAFFHPLLAEDPLIFVEVALTADVPASIGELLADDRSPLDPKDASCAVFYSISNCQAGLRGISFGNTLIKKVVGEIASTNPNIRTFITLSPLPGFALWIKDQAVIGNADAAALLERLHPAGTQMLSLASNGEVEGLVRQLGARYLLEARRSDGLPTDSVARFHLGNGARIERLHWLADDSPDGISNSFGLMVSYLYDLADIEINQDHYRNRRPVAATSAIRRLAESNGNKLSANRPLGRYSAG